MNIFKRFWYFFFYPKVEVIPAAPDPMPVKMKVVKEHLEVASRNLEAEKIKLNNELKEFKERRRIQQEKFEKQWEDEEERRRQARMQTRRDDGDSNSGFIYGDTSSSPSPQINPPTPPETPATDFGGGDFGGAGSGGSWSSDSRSDSPSTSDSSSDSSSSSDSGGGGSE